jgi:hypothetical protein
LLKRFLTISGLLLLLFNLASQGTLGGYYFLSSNGQTTIGHSHSDGDGIGYFHCHTVSEHGSMLVCEQIQKHLTTILHGRSGSATTCLPASILPIPNEERGSSPFFRSFSLVGADIWHLGISSGGIPS